VALLLEHLARTRRNMVGFLGGIHPAHEERFEHFRAGLHAAGLISKPAWQLFSTEALMQAGYAACRQLLAQNRRDLPAALVAGSDVVAIGALRALKEEGLNVPKDIAVTGFDDIPVAHLVTPALTTVRQPIARLTKLAFEAVIRPATQPVHTVCKPALVVRESA